MNKLIKILSLILILGLVGCGTKEIKQTPPHTIQNEISNLENVEKEIMQSHPSNANSESYYNLLTAIASPNSLTDDGEHVMAIIADAFYQTTKADGNLIHKIALIKDIANEVYEQKYITLLNNYIDNKETIETLNDTNEFINSVNDFVSINAEKDLALILNFDSQIASRNTIKKSANNISLENSIYTITVNEWETLQGEGASETEIYNHLIDAPVELTPTAFENLMNEYTALEANYTFTLKFTENPTYTYSKYKLVDASCTENIKDANARELAITSLIESYVSNPENIVHVEE